jgi:UDP-glucose 4-epimerase
MQWRGARVLVTGASGFIGRHLCGRLVSAGAKVFGTSRARACADLPDIRWLGADLEEATAVKALFDTVEPEFVFHLAGHVTGSQQLSEVLPTFAVNLSSTVRLLTAAASRGGCQVLLAGSMLEPDETDGTIGTPSSPYAASKSACAAYARMFHALYHLPVVIARPMMVYGPGQFDRGKLLPYVIESLLEGKIPALSAGTREIDWIFIDDTVDGLMRLAETPAAYGQVIDLGSGTLTSIRRVVEELIEIMGSPVCPDFGAVPERPFEPLRAARADETRRLSGWVPKTSLREGLVRTIEWHRQRMSLESSGSDC